MAITQIKGKFKHPTKAARRYVEETDLGKDEDWSYETEDLTDFDAPTRKDGVYLIVVKTTVDKDARKLKTLMMVTKKK